MMVVVMVAVSFVKVSAACAGGTAYNRTCAATNQASDQGAPTGSADDGSIPFPPVLTFVRYGHVIIGPIRLETGCW